MNLRKIINLPVYTQGNTYLGRLVDLEINPENGKIEKYFIKSSNFIKNLWQGYLVISPMQIISISSKKIIVKDNLKKIEELEASPAK